MRRGRRECGKSAERGPATGQHCSSRGAGYLRVPGLTAVLQLGAGNAEEDRGAGGQRDPRAQAEGSRAGHWVSVCPKCAYTACSCLQHQAGPTPLNPDTPSLRLLRTVPGRGSGTLPQQYPHWVPCSPKPFPLAECLNPTHAPAQSRPAVWAQGVQACPLQGLPSAELVPVLIVQWAQAVAKVTMDLLDGLALSDCAPQATGGLTLLPTAMACGTPTTPSSTFPALRHCPPLLALCTPASALEEGRKSSPEPLREREGL